MKMTRIKANITKTACNKGEKLIKKKKDKY